MISDSPELLQPQAQDAPSTLIGDDATPDQIAAITATLQPPPAPQPPPDQHPGQAQAPPDPTPTKIQNLQPDTISPINTNANNLQENTRKALEKKARTHAKIMDRRKARKIAYDLSMGRTAGDTLIRAGYSPATATVPAQITRHPLVIEARQELRDAILRKAPDYFDRLAATAVDGLTADKKIYASWEGRITDERSDPDHQARHRFLEMGARIFGLLREIDAPAAPTIQIGQLFLLMRQAEDERGLAQVDG